MESACVSDHVRAEANLNLKRNKAVAGIFQYTREQTLKAQTQKSERLYRVLQPLKMFENFFCLYWVDGV